jgi:hypothetical protein
MQGQNIRRIQRLPGQTGTHPHALAIPDPNDRTPNDPAVLVESKHIRQYYFNVLENDNVTLADQHKALERYAVDAQRVGWDVRFYGNSLLLHAQVQLTVAPSHA